MARWIVGLVLIGFGAPGIGGAGGASADKPVAISVWMMSQVDGDEGRVISQSTASFNRLQSRYRVELSPSYHGQHVQWVHQSAAAGTLPCVLQFDGPFLGEFAKPGYLLPLEDRVDPALRRDLLPSILVQGNFGGHLYAVGQFDSGLALWGNRRYLRAAGVRLPTVEHPWTLSEFEQALQRLARLRGVSYPLDMATYTLDGDFYTYAYSPLLQGFGADLIRRDGAAQARGTLDGPNAVAALQRLQSWFQRGWSREVVDHNDDFPRGRTALAWTGHWRYREFKARLGPDLVLLPLPDFGHGIKTGMGSWVWGISSTCQNPAGAWAFVEHLMSAREIQRMTAINGAVPARRSLLARTPEFAPGGPLHVYTEQLQRGFGVPRPASVNYSLISRSFATAVRSILQGGDVSAAMRSAAEAIDSELGPTAGRR